MKYFLITSIHDIYVPWSRLWIELNHCCNARMLYVVLCNEMMNDLTRIKHVHLMCSIRNIISITFSCAEVSSNKIRKKRASDVNCILSCLSFLFENKNKKKVTNNFKSVMSQIYISTCFFSFRFRKTLYENWMEALWFLRYKKKVAGDHKFW